MKDGSVCTTGFGAYFLLLVKEVEIQPKHRGAK